MSDATTGSETPVPEPGTPAKRTAADEVRALFEREMQGLLQGASEDVVAYLQGIANDAAMAAATHDSAWERELKAQLHTLGARQRVSAEHAGWRTLQGLIGAVVTLGTDALAKD